MPLLCYTTILAILTFFITYIIGGTYHIGVYIMMLERERERELRGQHSCSRGRFGFDSVWGRPKVVNPMIWTGGCKQGT